MPNSVVNSPKFLKPNVHTQIGQKEVEKGITGAGLTSIGGVHVVMPKHADEGRAVTASGARAANTASPPVAPAGQGSGILGVRPGMHGARPKAMQLGATSITPTTVSKVNYSVDVAAGLSACESFSQSKTYDEQGSMLPSSTAIHKQNEGKKLVQHTYEQIVAFGGIQEEAMRETRSSGRLRMQNNADMTQMERAMMIAKSRDDTPVIGMSPVKPTSITAFSDDQIIDDARLLGVSLGTSFSDCTKSAKIIKDFEKNRSVSLLKSKNALAQKCMMVSRASDLCDDLEAEEDFLSDESLEMPKANTREKKTRKKKSYDKENVRRSTRVKFKPSKLQ
jgi:hypothetical protein